MHLRRARSLGTTAASSDGIMLFMFALKHQVKGNITYTIQTPLDSSFWRPYARGISKDASKPAAGGNRTQLIFVAGAEGTGHHFATALMMRLPDLLPMSLVQEQAVQALW